MKTIRNYSIILLVVTLFISSCASSKFNVVKVNGQKEVSDKDGVFYKLSQTTFVIDVTVTKVEKVKGPYAEFAGKYLGLSNVISENSAVYGLTDIAVESLISPDPSQNYFIEMDGSSKQQAGELQLVLSESGILLNTMGEEQNANGTQERVFQPEADKVFPDVFKYFSDLNLFEQVDTIIERVNLDTATIEKMVFRRTLVEKTTEQKAKDAADFIIKVKENRLNLISGYQEVNYDKETFTLMNSELEKLETEYQKLFTGLTFTRTQQYHFTYTPDASKKSDTIALFRFSSLRGMLDTTNMNGEPAWLIINADGGCQPISEFVNEKDSLKHKSHGLYYRMPEFAALSLVIGDEPRLVAKYPVNQYGVVSWLPARNLAILLYPNTSGIRKIKF